MTARRMVLVATCGFVAIAVCLAISRSEAEQVQGRLANSKLVVAANEALMATIAEQQAGKATVEDIYQWSRRLMEAELLQGVKDAKTHHADRMRELYKKVDALHLIGAVGGSTRDYLATKYYSLEADSLLTK